MQNFKFLHCENNIAKLIQNIPRAAIRFHTIYCVKIDIVATVSWRVAEHGIRACKWNIFMRLTTARLISEQCMYFGMTNINSTHGKNIVHCSGPDMVKSTIVLYVFRTLTLWNSLSRYCHEEIWRDSFSPSDTHI